MINLSELNEEGDFFYEFEGKFYSFLITDQKKRFGYSIKKHASGDPYLAESVPIPWNVYFNYCPDDINIYNELVKEGMIFITKGPVWDPFKSCLFIDA